MLSRIPRNFDGMGVIFTGAGLSSKEKKDRIDVQPFVVFFPYAQKLLNKKGKCNFSF